MVLIKVLKRRDAASVVVAIVVAMIVSQLLSAWTEHFAGWLSGLQTGQYASSAMPGAGGRGQYVFPLVSVVLQLLLLEVLIRLYVWFMAGNKK